MKLKLFFSMMAVAAMTFTGCNKQTELEINYGQTGTLTGKVTLFDQDGATSQAGADVVVIAKADYSSLISGTTVGQNTKKEFKTTTDAEGNYKFDLPVNYANGTTSYEISTVAKIIENKIYTSTATPQDITLNSTEFLNINMYCGTQPEAVYTIKGKIVTTTTGSTKVAVKGCEITATVNSTDEFTTVTNANGEYTLQIPAVNDVESNITIDATYTDEEGNTLKANNEYLTITNEDGTTYTVEDIEIRE